MKKILVMLLLTVSAATAFQRTFLMPEEAFKASAAVTETQHIEATIVLGEGIYIYREKLAVKVLKPDTVTIDQVTVLTPAEEHDGEQVYTADVKIDISLAASEALSGKVPIDLQLDFQGCSEQGLCYEPQSKRYALEVDASSLGSASPTVLADEKAAIPATVPSETAADAAQQMQDAQNETDMIVNALKGENIWTVLALFFGFGLALSLTPCIFPMIPILSSIIVSQGENLSAKRGFMLSLIYVLAMAVAYAIAGVFAGMFGENLQVILQNPWAIGAFALIFVALAFSMFGFYEIGLPAALQTRISRVSDQAGQKGGFAGVAVMGFLSALIVGPCVAPGLAAALIYIGQTGNMALGGAALFVMSLGMGIPLLLIGLGAGKFMPRPGGWMNTVTEVFGVVMIGIAIWMVSRIIPPWITMMLWSIFFIVSAVYMGAFEPLREGVRTWKAFFKALGVVFMMYGAILLVGALSGGTSMMHPLKGFQVSLCDNAAAATEQLHFEVIHTSGELDAILARSRGKKVMLDFSAGWCTACMEYEEITFKDPRVVSALRGFVLVQANVTDNTPEEKTLTKRFGLFGPPGIVFFNEQGNMLGSKTLVGYTEPGAFLAHLRGLQ